MMPFRTSNTTAQSDGVETERYSKGEPTPWHMLVFITALFYIIGHNFYASLNTSYSDIALAGDKAASVAGGNISRQIGYVTFGLYGVFGWLRKPRFLLNRHGFLASMLVAFLAWAVMSLAWSTAPELTVRRLSSLGLMALGISGMLRQVSGVSVVKVIFFSTLSYLIVGLGAEVVLGTFTPLASGYRFAGTLLPNLQGINCAALTLSAIALSIASDRHRGAFAAVALSAVIFLVLTGSRGALAGGIAGLTTVWLLRTPQLPALMTICAVACIVLLSLFLILNGLAPSPVDLLIVERAPGAGLLTGRADLWGILIDYAHDRPVLGYGYGAFFSAERGLDLAARVGTWAFGGPHSIYFGTLVDLGATGLVALLGVLLGGVWESVRAYRNSLEPWYVLFAGLLVFQIVDGITEAEMVTPTPHLIPCLAIAFLAFRQNGRGRLAR